jgi:hypothetical protein
MGQVLWTLLLLCVATASATAQVVSVTLSLDTNRVAAGTSTTLHAYARIVPGQRAVTDRIFSWYVDLLNSDGQVAKGNYDALQKPAADKDPLTSSPGLTSGDNRVGIYDTFLSLPGAGRDVAVELFSVPVTGLVAGHATLSVRAGTGVPALSQDFIVAPTGGGDPIFGGDYTAAHIDLEVAGGVELSIVIAPLPGGQQRVTLSFPTTTGKNYFVEYRDQLGAGPNWQSLPGSPHNASSVSDTNGVPQRFYRVRVTD